MRDPQGRGGHLSWTTVREGKVRHGRQETRRLWALSDPAVNAYAGSSGEHGTPWPHVQQVCRIERERRQVRRGRVVERQVEVTYAITSRAPQRADAAALLRANRAHWSIENGSHWLRDAILGEDACLVRSGAAPRVLAACRNLTLTLLRRAGYAGIAAALRTLAARPAVAVALVCAAGLR